MFSLLGLTAATVSTAASRPPLPVRVSYPCVGLAATPARELLVVGTAHTPCRSAAEVSAVIASAKPDVVVLELDQERLERLLRDSGERRYGADFAAAAEAATRLGVPIILGDVKARQTVASLRAFGPIADGRRLLRAARLTFARRAQRSDDLRVQPAAILDSLRDDPAKLLPLQVGLTWTVLLSTVVALMMPDSVAPDASSANWLATAGSTTLAVGVLALALRVFDVILLSRDEALAASALRGLELASSLRSGTLLRRRYTFGTDPAVLAAAPTHPEGTLPFFTLRRPLARGEVRRLNLFEPRWLNLLDRLAAANGPDGDGADSSAAPGAADPSRLVNATFGVVFAVNRIYAPAMRGGEELWAAPDDDACTERVADVVVRPVARRARIVRAEASVRPVSGDRRLEVWIQGEDVVRIDAQSLEAAAGGYLAAHVSPGEEGDMEGDAAVAMASPEPAAGESVRVVSVVGLAHANGVLERCAERSLADAASLDASVGPESEWVGY